MTGFRKKPYVLYESVSRYESVSCIINLSYIKKFIMISVSDQYGSESEMSRLIRKPAFCICKNKSAD